MTDVQSLVALSEQMLAAQERVLDLEARLKLAKMRLAELETRSIPDAMETLGVASLSAADGSYEIGLEDVLSVRPSPQNRPRVLDVVREMGYDGLIKTSVVANYSKGKDGAARDLFQTLADSGQDVQLSAKIEPQTLKKFVTDRLASGDDIDLELFGVYRIRRAKFTKGAPKEPIFDESEEL